MTLKEKQLEFIIYCIENTAERLGRYSADVYNKLKELVPIVLPVRWQTGTFRLLCLWINRNE